ncbi:MAG: right-handed parallel beta-helix repeat-containing protein [Methylococcales bacterium]|nr:right-handed parallel beta-helix repeat-containing protein [Methylococcales bacterium]
MSKKIALILFCSLALGGAFPAYSANYYVSDLTGNDANNGSEAQPWKTIERANQEKYADNSSILFKRGEVFRGVVSADTFQSNLTFGAYGEGPNPVISGSVQITNWKPTTHSGLSSAVYEADVSAFITPNINNVENTINHLFVNGEMMTIARYPNVDSPAEKNWLKVGASAGDNAFTDPALANYPKPDGYWKDATLRIRTYSWYYKVFKVTGYKAANGQINATGLRTQLPEWGYFLDDKLEELDHPGEWYYDAKTKKVYLYPRKNRDPNTVLIEGSTYRRAIDFSWHEDNNVVENLTFRHFTFEGVKIYHSNNVTVRNCHFEYNTIGVSVWQSPNLLVSENTFNNQLSIGILLNGERDFDVENSVVERNEINNTGMFPLYCERYEGVCYGLGISVFGRAQSLRQNTINTTGWTGIYLKASGHHYAENNLVRNALSLLNDGGAMSIGSDANVIRGNFLLDSVGNIDESNGCANLNNTPCTHHTSYGMGIGSDNDYRDNVIEGNTIANNPDMGIRLNRFKNTTVRNNVVFNNDPQMAIEGTSAQSAQNIIEGNTLYSLTPNQRGLVLSGTVDHGTFNNKRYCNPYGETVLVKNNKSYSLARWKTLFPDDEPDTKGCDLNLKIYQVSQVIGANLLTKTGFEIVLETAKKTAPNSNRFAVSKNQVYRLKFNAVGNGMGSLRVELNHAPKDGKWKRFETITVAYDSTNKAHELFFVGPDDRDEMVLSFSSIKEGGSGADALTIDSLTFEAVAGGLNDAKKQSVLFSNITAHEKTVSLNGTLYKDLDGRDMGESLVLAPFSSQILIYVSGKRPPSLGNLKNPPMTLKRTGRIIDITWEAEVDAEGYRLYYAPKPYTGAKSIQSFDVKNQTHFRVELPSGSAFHVAVKAYNKLGESDYSNIESFLIP